MLTGYLLEIGQVVLALAVSPGLVGFVRVVKAKLQGRQGPPLLQPYYDLRKLFGKDVIVSENASWLFRFTPYLLFATTVVVIFLVPLLAAPLPFDKAGDLLVVVYLLLLGTFFLALAGLDPGTAFGGMGASREMTIAAIAEPAMALSIFGLALGAGSTNLGRIVEHSLLHPEDAISPGHLLGFASLFIITLAETGRLPVDNPSTHLELTMIHEAMILEYSGRYLALIEWAAGLKLLIFFALLANMFFPWGVATELSPAALAISVTAFIAKIAFLALIMGMLETRLAKLRLFRVPELLALSFVLALLGVITSYLLR